MNYRYLKGSEHSCESVEFDTAETTCVVNVDLLLCGVKKFPCGDGSDERLTTERRYEILKFVEQEREKLVHKDGAKSMEDWENSGLGSFDEFFFPGDTVAEDVYDNFLNILPPATMRQNLLQVGEPAAHEKDPATGNYRATYSTFVRTDGLWWYAGECFRGETVNRRTRPGRLAERIAEVEKDIERENRKGEQQ